MKNKNILYIYFLFLMFVGTLATLLIMEYFNINFLCSYFISIPIGLVLSLLILKIKNFHIALSIFLYITIVITVCTPILICIFIFSGLYWEKYFENILIFNTNVLFFYCILLFNYSIFCIIVFFIFIKPFVNHLDKSIKKFKEKELNKDE
ncbi:hypothetical protein [Campylobacter sputorum]|uniref:hypothetical protein n=1 Tax=Campylobacter sputorum TaxID=206 RepID=UPI000B781626|nr:hypothetical protein [Campylobacter sputorum]ASM36874.1 hypothetical protein CSF_1007 [Campylobacter sputorum bv. faecalis CCUG 20703]